MVTPKHLIDLYSGFDKAHNHSHRIAVRDKARYLAEIHAPEFVELATLAAELHDIGLVGGRDGHEKRGAQMAIDHYDFLSTTERDIVYEAIAEHRASNGDPKHIVAKIVSDSE